jgi:hypothetical protein
MPSKIIGEIPPSTDSFSDTPSSPIPDSELFSFSNSAVNVHELLEAVKPATT